jgi:hypothetical protein
MTIIRPLESVLEDKEMFKQIKNFLQSSGYEIPEQNIDDSRRNFMKSSAGLAAGLAVGGLGFSSKAEAASFLSFLKIPGPGSKNSRYQDFAYVYNLGGTDAYSRTLLSGLLNPSEKNSVIYQGREYKLPPEMPFIEPLYYFAAQTLKKQYSRESDHWQSDLPKKNLALDHFDCCIRGFSSIWITKKLDRFRGKEEEFALKSICVAAFGTEKGEQAAKGMLDSSVEGKKIYAKNIIESFDRMNGYKKNSKDPQNPFNQALVANWAAYVITNHFENLQINQGGLFTPDSKYYGEIRFYQDNLEKPLENLFTSKKVKGYRIRPNFDTNEEYHHMNKFKIQKDYNGRITLGAWRRA